MPAAKAQATRPGHSGFHHDSTDGGFAWLKEEALLRLPPLKNTNTLCLRGALKTNPALGRGERGRPALVVGISGAEARRVAPRGDGSWSLELAMPRGEAARGAELRLIIEGVAFSNALAWLARITRLPALQRFRSQARNRQLRLLRLETAQGELVCDFTRGGGGLEASFLRTHARLGLNVVGWLDRELGLGEGARCMLRAAAAVALPAVPLQLRLPCRAAGGNTEFSPAPEGTALQAVSVFHIDPPAAREIDRRQGPALRRGRRNIGYWAWELPEFPDAWCEAFEAFDEIWCPSEFVRAAVAAKSPLPVLTMPHAVSPTLPEGDGRARFKLPRDRFLFLVCYDLNSYTARKNPGAALEAFALSRLGGEGRADLVIKVHNSHGNEAALENLRAQCAALPGTQLLTETLPRAEMNLLTASCDAFVSLHRSEGFGLSVAEAMALGRPVIVTDWSATAEYAGPHNACPVRHTLVRIERDEGPYAKGGTWAEAEAGHAAEWMRRLVEEPGLAGRLGARAAHTIAERFAPAVIGELYRRRLAAIARFSPGDA